MKFLQWLHRWTGLIIVLQIVLWTISGLYFALVDHHGMKGHQYRSEPQLVNLDLQHARNMNPSWWSNFDDIRLLRHELVQGIPKIEVHHRDGVSYLNGQTGETWVTSENLAKEIALSTYSGPGTPTRVTPISTTRELHDWQGEGYKVDFNDDLNTRVYVDSTSGSVIDHRNTPWVVADWMFRLHFIDYTGGRNFNNLVIVTAGVVTLWFALSGFILLVKLLVSGEMRFSFRNVPLWATIGSNQHKFSGRAHKSVLQALQDNEVLVESGCGGGGSCGLCKVTVNGQAQITAAEHDLLSPQELNEGIRLACQHSIAKVQNVEVPEVNAQKHSLTLLTSRFLTPMLRELRFRAEEGDVEYLAGQYMQFLIPDGITAIRPCDIPEEFHPNWAAIQDGNFKHIAVRRSYSMATKQSGDELVFTVRYQPQAEGAQAPGVGSTYLCNLKVGEHVIVEGPYGDFTRMEGANRKLFFIGGGAGMAPLRALVQEELSTPEPRDMVFYYGARDSNELVYRNELEALAAAEQIHFVPVLSDAPSHSDWAGARGFVHEQALAYLSSIDIDEYDFYVCGPPRMLSATLDMLANLGVSQDRIRFDDFGN
ncbi:NADH:ubiquinone oxidoreductase [Aliidiomarina shirensis]|uniref:NADH:ubiquinone oxidoreductase n=1 Tax=Aliidiomarina shirensis TaxID=1048642 RepID=A0A432WSW6_9GAMM|nr:2Fe-2S iron-sulfur cluster-binding protein [Aliidiomarina shirensis]RUO36837.1 NADH:ubiquinone oxidoreductase [Aliidiomarina shirensis]